jgi:transposase
MSTHIRKAFEIPKELFILSLETNKNKTTIYCRTQAKKKRCIHCGKSTRNFGTVVCNVRHNTIGAKTVYLHITKRRLQCKYCKRVFREPITGLGRQRTSDHFVQLVQEKSRNQDFSSVANELGVSPSMVMRKQDELDLCQFATPEHEEIYLGLDGKYLNGDHEIFVMGDVKHREFFGVTSTNNLEVLKQVLTANLLDQGKRVVVVSIDMCKRFKGLADTLFPEADIVVDKFHVVKYVHRTIDLCRVAVEKSNNERFGIKRMLLMKMSTFHKIETKPKWEQKAKYFRKLLREHPEINILWELKNLLHSFYQADNRKTAERRFQKVLTHLAQHRKTHPEFNDLQTTLERWRAYIINHFDEGITNAYVEGLNNKIETLKRKKCGYRSVERFLKSVVFSLLPIITFIPCPLFIN